MSGSLATNSDRAIATSRVFDAPRELVFRAWTDPEHVKNWWGPRGFTNTIEHMDVREGGEWLFVMHGPDGTDYKNRIVYSEVVPPSLLRYSHVTGPVFDVTVRFEEVTGDGQRETDAPSPVASRLSPSTRVTVEMVFASAELRDRVAKEYGAVEGLEQTLTRLEEQLAQRDEWSMSRTFDAPIDLVWRAWTEREHLLQWFSPRGVTMFSCTNDPRPGGMMHYGLRTPDGMEYWGRWIYRELTPPRKLVFVVSFADAEGNITWHPMAPDWPREMLSTVTFAEADGKTTVTIQWAPINTTAAGRKAFDEGRASLHQGWTGTLDQLEAHVAKERS